MKYSNKVVDAAFSFLTSKLEHIESKMFEVEYPFITYKEIIPVSMEAGAGATSIAYFTLDRVGMAKWIASDATDVPMVDVKAHKSTIPVELGGVGFDYNLEELRQAAQVGGTPLQQLKANAAREAYEEHVDSVAFLGDTDKNLPGFLTNAFVPRADAVVGGGGDFRWSTKTAFEIIFDINAILTDVYTTTLNRHIPSTILLPPSLLAVLSAMPMGADAQQTVLTYIEKNNIYTHHTGVNLSIKSCRYLEHFPDTPSTESRRMIAYTPTNDVLVYHIPKPLEFYAPQLKAYTFIVPGDYKLGGVEIRKPLTMKFVKIDDAL